MDINNNLSQKERFTIKINTLAKKIELRGIEEAY